MKSQNLNFAILFGVLAVAAAAWKLMPEPAVHDSYELSDIRSHTKANQGRSVSPTFSNDPATQGSRKPEVTKVRVRPRSGQSPQADTHEPAAKPDASPRQNIITERARASARENLLHSPLPTPAVFIALDPSVSGIPATQEPVVQAMAEQAADILKEHETEYQEIEENTDLSQAEKKSAWLELRENASDRIDSIEYAFRAKYGTRAWIMHHIAAHREFSQQE